MNSKYLKYAIGEILLVVVGILIALSLNNWNQKRLEKKKEVLILKELHQEFIANRTQLDTVYFNHKRAFESGLYLKKAFPIQYSDSKRDSLERAIHYMRNNFTFNPSQGIIMSILNTSSYDIVSNTELRKIIISWPDILKDYQEEELIALNNYHQHFHPYMSQHMILKTGHEGSLNDPRIDHSFLTSLSFENIIHNRTNDLNNILNDEEFPRIKSLIDRIIELTKPKQ